MVFRFVVFVLLGLAVGVFARWRLPKGDASGWFAPVTLATAGSILGGSIAAMLYRDDGPIVFILAAIASVTVIIIYQAIAQRHMHA